MGTDRILAAIDAEIKRLQQVRKLLAGTGAQSPAAKPATRKRKHMMSAAARKRIADAQRARWEKQRRKSSVIYS